MNNLFSISASIFGVILFLKIAIHVWLDNANEYRIAVAPSSRWVYFLPYDKEVKEEHVGIKAFCNALQKLSILLLPIVLLLAIFQEVYT